MKCLKCGSVVEDGKNICDQCHTPLSENAPIEEICNISDSIQEISDVEEQKEQKSPQEEKTIIEQLDENKISSVKQNDVIEDRGSFAWILLGFFFPLIGIILFILWQKQKPKSSKKSGIGALISIIIQIVIILLYFFLLGQSLKKELPNQKCIGICTDGVYNKVDNVCTCADGNIINLN